MPKKFRKAQQLKTLQELISWMDDANSWVYWLDKPMSTAFLRGMTLRRVLVAIRAGIIYAAIQNEEAK